MGKPVKQPIIFEELTYQIIGIAIEIHKTLGNIHKESVYQKALEHEFKEKNISFDREKRIPVTYNGSQVGIYVPDFVVDNKVVIEMKATPLLPSHAYTQLSYYLKTSGYRVGLLINFGTPTLQVKRSIYG